MRETIRLKDNVLSQLAGHLNLGGLKLWPEVPRDDSWVHHGLHDISTNKIEKLVG
jgi:hypothetical protein